MTTYTATNAATLQTALADAVGGDRIELAGGNYGEVTINNVFPNEVVVAAANSSAAPPVFANLHVNGAVHLTFDWLFLQGNNDAKPFTVTDCSYIKFSNCTFRGTLNNGYGYRKGMQVLHSNHITFENNEFFLWMKALAVGASNDLVIRGNNIHTINADGFNFTADVGLLIEGNWLHDFDTNPTIGHTDFLQVWNPTVDNPLRQMTIRGNFFDAGTGSRKQTIFMGNGKAAADPTNLSLYFRDILIEDNVIYNAHSHGISPSECINLTIRNNTLLLDRWVNGDIFHAPRIGGKSTSQNVVVEKNIVHIDWGGRQLVVQDTDPNGANYYGDLFVNAMAQGARLSDLRAVSGGLIEAGGWGARMTRENIMLNVGPGAPPMSDPLPVPDPVPLPDPEPDPVPDPVPDPEPTPDPTPTPLPTEEDMLFYTGPHSFNGLVSSAVILPHAPEYELAEGSVEMLMTTGSVGGRKGLFSKDARNFGLGGHLGILMDGTTLWVRLQSTTQTHEVKVLNLFQNMTEYHLAVTWGSGGLNVWVDGVLRGVANYIGGTIGNVEPVVIGANQWSSSAGTSNTIIDPFDGEIEHVAIWGHALSGDEIQTIITPITCEEERDALLIEVLELEIEMNVFTIQIFDLLAAAAVSADTVDMLSTQVVVLEDKIAAAKLALA